MKIVNVRKGFANNSSSKHSIVFLGGQRVDNSTDSDFGWDFFTVSSESSKKAYLKATLFNNLRSIYPETIASSVADHTYPDAEEAYVDHQSVLTIPHKFSEREGLDLDFFKAWSSFILRDDVAILGGNDNTDLKHPLSYLTESFKYDLERDSSPSSNYVSRYDEENNYWSIFNRVNGDKIRLVFPDEKGVYTSPVKGSVPELVDISITDYCAMGCQFCYRGSTTSGKHADFEYLEKLARTLGELQVWEVAIGGGEPTDHPRFIEILEMFRKRGVIPNFTTRKIDWIKDSRYEKIASLAGSFAFSSESVKAIRQVGKLLQKARDKYPGSFLKASVHLVMGTFPMHKFADLVNAAYSSGFSVTLLGYKTDFRGSEFLPEKQDYSDWVDIYLKKVLPENSWRGIGLDTPMIHEFKEALEEHNVSPVLYHTEEGTFSCFVDAVKQTLSASSYGKVQEFTLDLPFHAYSHGNRDQFKELFNGLSVG